MRKLLNRRRDECERLQDLLESSAAADMLGGSMEELVGNLPADGRVHSADCRGCREALQDLLATRELLLGAVAPAEDGGPWFAKRAASMLFRRLLHIPSKPGSTAR